MTRSKGRRADIVHDPVHGAFPIRTERLDPPRYAAFRWMADREDRSGEGPSTLTEFWIDENESGSGVTLRVSESGFSTLDISAEEQRKRIDENTEGWETARGRPEVRGGGMTVVAVADVFAAHWGPTGSASQAAGCPRARVRNRAGRTDLGDPAGGGQASAGARASRARDRDSCRARGALRRPRRGARRSANWLSDIAAQWDRRLATIRVAAEAAEGAAGSTDAR